MSIDEAVEEAVWDLSDILGPGTVDDLLADADGLVEAFERHRGKVATLDAAGLAVVMQESAAIADLLGRAGNYAYLVFAADTSDPANGALIQKVEERSTAVTTRMLFLDLEWAALDDAAAEGLLADERLTFCGHHLRNLRALRPHLLSEGEERLMAEKAVTGSAAWSRLFNELTSAIEVSIDDEVIPLDTALSRLASPDRERRRRTAEAITAALAPGLRTRAYVFNTLMADKATDDRLRKFPHWLASRNLSNEASDESVEALIDSVRRRYDIPKRWYALKARIFGVERLADYDRNASVASEEVTVQWEEARDLVLDCYGSFSPKMADLARRFFDERWIDAPVRPGKQPGAFATPVVPSVHPYVFLNWTSRANDVLTLAHELGHGLHFALAAEQGVFHQSTPLTLAETASVFGETVVFSRLIEQEKDPNARLTLLAENIEGAIATVFRQAAMNRFEHLVHTARREEGELSVERFGELWAESQTEMLGPHVEVTEGYRSWWSYIPHFIGTPGYVYAYSYGQLLALSVYRRYEEQGPDFVSNYLRLLAAGGSDTPENLGRIVGCDLADAGFWDGGLAIIEATLDAAENAAFEAGRLGAG